MNEQNKTKQKIFGLDLIKALAIISVISLHTGLWNVDFLTSRSLGSILQYSLRLLAEGVPAFIMVNGFLLLGKSKWDMRKHAHKILRIFLLLLVWIGILIFAGALITGERLTIDSFFQYYFSTAIGSKYSGVLWFLENLLSVYLVFPCIKFIFDRDKKLYFYIFTLVAFFTVGVNTIGLIRDFLSIYFKVDLLNTIIGFIDRFNPIGNSCYVYYFLLGGILFLNKDWILRKRRTLILSGGGSLCSCCGSGDFP